MKHATSGHARPLGDIAVSLSGGGFRAAAFHLGSLDLLDQAGLIDDVRMISTASGGTFPGMVLAQTLTAGKTFKIAYDRLYTFLSKVNVPKEVIAALGRQKSPKSLIRAAAEVYDAKLFEGTTFATIKTGQLQEIIFNSTEFARGLNFRFQRSSITPYANAPVGNTNVNVVEKDVDRIRLGDILAASSCFPGGFEPLVLPDDFIGGDDIRLELDPKGPLADTGCDPKVERIALMDGGIYDNQGVDSLLLAQDRRAPCPVPLGLVIVSDTSQVDREIYATRPRPKRTWWTVGRVAEAVLFTLSTCCALIVLTLVLRLDARDLGVSDLPLVPAAVLLASLVFLTARVRDVFDSLGLPADVAHDMRDVVHKLPWSDAVHMARIRLGSMIAMVSDVFMARIRRLVYDRLYEDAKYRPLTIANLIYNLSDDKLKKYKVPAPPERTPAEPVKQLVADIVQMPTLLWFTREGQLDDLIAAGQCTMCFNLLEQPGEAEGPTGRSRRRR